MTRYQGGPQDGADVDGRSARSPLPYPEDATIEVEGKAATLTTVTTMKDGSNVTFTGKGTRP